MTKQDTEDSQNSPEVVQENEHKKLPWIEKKLFSFSNESVN